MRSGTWTRSSGWRGSTAQNGVDVPFTYDRLQAKLEDAERTVAKQNRIVVRATLAERRFARRARALDARADRAKLLSERLDLEQAAFQMDSQRVAAAQTVTKAKKKLKKAEKTLAKVRSSSWTSSFAPGTAVFGTPIYIG